MSSARSVADGARGREDRPVRPVAQDHATRRSGRPGATRQAAVSSPRAAHRLEHEPAERRRRPTTPMIATRSPRRAAPQAAITEELPSESRMTWTRRSTWPKTGTGSGSVTTTSGLISPTTRRSKAREGPGSGMWVIGPHGRRPTEPSARTAHDSRVDAQIAQPELDKLLIDTRILVRMREVERRARLVEHLRADGRVSVAQMADGLGVTASTIRRDLERLAREGRVVRTYGGAALPTAGSAAARGDPARDAKLGSPAPPRHWSPDEATIVIGSGSTALAFARELADSRLTVITNALDVANVLAGPARGSS